MLITFFSTKGSPGVTSAALTIASIWPRPVVLVEADPTGGDLIYRCRSAAGGPVAVSPSILGFASAVRGDRATALSQWVQPLANGVQLIAGVTSPAQGRGLAGLWRDVASAAVASEPDVIVDLGRIDREDPAAVLVRMSDIAVPVISASLESFMHGREMLKEGMPEGRGRTVPLLIGQERTAAADGADLDEVLVSAGVIAAQSVHLPTDQHGLKALEGGANPAGRGRMSHLVRSARTAADQLLEAARIEVAP